MNAEEAKKYLEDKVSNADLTSSYVGVNWRDVYKTAIDALEETKHYGECLKCKHMHCDTWCDHGEAFESK